MNKKISFQILLLWLFLVILGLNGRSYFPIDETRYVTVAWNMWLNGDYLVPYLNGIAYSHKPPLLFWLINIGWKIFGVNDWWPRLIPSLFALASVFITRKISNRIWPAQINLKDSASLILIGSGLWIIYSTALMFDMMIAFFTVLGVWGLLIALQERAIRGWLLLTLAIGGGLLAKGPTILLQLLPVALLANWWSADKNLSAKNWYLPLLYSVLGGALMVLAWAIPAGIHGGSVYQHDIFWGQTANRMVNSFAHERPLWWYLAYMPLLFFPWLLWGAFWKGIFNLKIDMGIRFCIAWALPVFIAFSFISGKQVHYVLPIFPAMALLVARYSAVAHHIENQTNSRFQLLPIALSLLILGAVLFALPQYAQSHANLASWIQKIPQWLGIFIILLAALVYYLPKKTVSQVTAQLSISTIALTTILMYVLMHSTGSAYDVRPISTKLNQLESQNIPVAYMGRYPGIFNFLGRLEKSPENVNRVSIEPWFAAHPNGRVIEYFDEPSDVNQNQVEFTQAYKGAAIAILNHEQWLTNKKSPSSQQDD